MRRRDFLFLLGLSALSGCSSTSDNTPTPTTMYRGGYIDAAVSSETPSDVVTNPEEMLAASEPLNDSVRTALQSPSGEYSIEVNASEQREIMTVLNEEYSIDSGVFYLSTENQTVKIRLVERT